MNTIFLTVPPSEPADKTVDLVSFKLKAKDFFRDERVKKTLQIVSFIAPFAAGPLASAPGRILPAVAKGMKYAPNAINCVVTLATA